MYNTAIEILKILEDNGFKAYIVGGFVRDKLIGISSNDIDMCTSARPEELSSIFNNVKVLSEYGAVKLNYNNYKFDISTFREDIKYGNDRKQLEIKYVNDISDDVLRRDFTVNSLYMDKDKNIYDYVGGKNDIQNKIIKSIGNSNKKLTEDPLRILRAIRYAVKLNFELDEELSSSISENKEFLLNLSYFRKREELDKMFKLNNLTKVFNLLIEFDLLKYLEIECNDEVISCSDPLGVWAQLEFSTDYPFSNSDLDKIQKLKDIIKSKKIDEYTVYKYGIDMSLIAAEILSIDKNYVLDMYNNLKIRNIKDIKISYNTISSLRKDLSKQEINDILREIEKKIVYNEISNEEIVLIKYVNESRWKYE